MVALFLVSPGRAAPVQMSLGHSTAGQPWTVTPELFVGARVLAERPPETDKKLVEKPRNAVVRSKAGAHAAKTKFKAKPQVKKKLKKISWKKGLRAKRASQAAPVASPLREPAPLRAELSGRSPRAGVTDSPAPADPQREGATVVIEGVPSLLAGVRGEALQPELDALAEEPPPLVALSPAPAPQLDGASSTDADELALVAAGTAHQVQDVATSHTPADDAVLLELSSVTGAYAQAQAPPELAHEPVVLTPLPTVAAVSAPSLPLEMPSRLLPPESHDHDGPRAGQGGILSRELPPQKEWFASQAEQAGLAGAVTRFRTAIEKAPRLVLGAADSFVTSTVLSVASKVRHLDLSMSGSNLLRSNWSLRMKVSRHPAGGAHTQFVLKVPL